MGLWWQGGPRGPGDMVCRLRVWEELSFFGVDPRASMEWGRPNKSLFYQDGSYSTGAVHSLVLHSTHQPTLEMHA